MQTTGVRIMVKEILKLMTVTYGEVTPKATNERMPSIMPRELIEIRHEWVCSQCGYVFFNPGCVLTGLTLNKIILHLKKMREQAFANHICLNYSET
jgi:hypothetical protein